jgi:hypothetical protein
MLFDYIGYEEAWIRAFEALEDFKEGFLFAESSKRHYHLVFNRRTAKSKVISMIATICLRTRDEELTRWFLNQFTRGNFTLRISSKGKKPSPKIVFRYGKQDKETKRYLQHRRFIRGNFFKLADSMG